MVVGLIQTCSIVTRIGFVAVIFKRVLSVQASLVNTKTLMTTKINYVASNAATESSVRLRRKCDD